MGDVGKVVIGGILTVAGIAMQFFPPTAPFAPFVMYAGSLIMQSGMQGLNEEQASIQSNTTGQQVDLPIIYGKDVRVGHTNADVFTYGDQGDMLYIVGAIGVTSDITYGGISAVKEIYNDSENAVMASDVDGLSLDTFTVDEIYGQITGVRSEWAVTLPVWVGGIQKTASYFSYHLHSGSGTGSGPVVDEMLTTVRPGAWPSTSQGVGIAYAVNHFVFSEELYSTFPQLTYLVDGNVIKDFRDDQPVDSTNPALVLYDYLVSKRYGLGLDPTDLDVSGTFTEVANWCELTTTMTAPYGKLVGSGWGLQTETASDTTITANGFANSSIKSLFEYLEIGDVIKITSGDNAGSSFEVTGWTPGGYGQVIITVSPAVPVANDFMSFEVYRGTVATPYEIPNAEISGILRTASSHKDNIDKILDAMRGKLYWQDGKIKLWVRKPETAQTTVLDASTNVSDIQIARAGVSEKYNSVSAKYVDPAQEHEVEEIVWPPSTTTNLYLAEDNGFPSRLDVEFPLVSNSQVVWKFCEVALKESRQDTTVELTATEDALQFEIGDVVKLTDDTVGWTEKEFWVLSMTLTSDNLIRMVLKEYDSSVYTSSGQMTESGVPGSDLPSPLYMAPPTGLTLTSDANTVVVVDEAGTYLQGIEAEWTTSSSTNLLKEEAYYKETGDTVWKFGGFRYKHERDDTTNKQLLLISPVKPNVGHDVKVEAVSNLGVRSEPVSGTITTGSVPTIGGGGGGCPNLMGIDGGLIKGGTLQGTGTITQWTYNTIDISTSGLWPGIDNISFCANLWVGPATQPTSAGCGGKLGQVESGLIYRQATDPMGNPIGTSTQEPQREWRVTYTQAGSPLYARKDGANVFEFPDNTLGVAGYSGVMYKGYGSPADTSVGQNELYVHARYQNEGVESLLIGGNSVSLGAGAGRTFKAIDGVGYYTAQPTMRFLTSPTSFDTSYEMTCGATYGGLYNGSAISILYQSDTGTSFGSVGSFITKGRQFRMFVGKGASASGEQWFFNPGSGVIASSTTRPGPYWLEIGRDNESYTHTSGIAGSLGANANVDVGRVWWWDITIMKDHKIHVTGLTPGDYVVIGGDNAGGAAYSLEGADANGEVDVYLTWSTALASNFGVTTTQSAYAVDVPLYGGASTSAFEIWDDPPWDGGTRTYQCIDSSLEFYGGDVWEYDSTGSITAGETLTNVYAVLVLEFLDSLDTENAGVISSVETTQYGGTVSTSRIGVADTTIPAGTQAIRLRLEKRGSGDGWAKAAYVQLNRGSTCCEFQQPNWWEGTDASPTYTTIPGTTTGEGGTGGDTETPATDEFRQGGGNLLAESRDERTISAQTGNVDGTDYTRVTLADYGLEPGDKISIRGKVKAT